jgi:hypothetical protein
MMKLTLQRLDEEIQSFFMKLNQENLQGLTRRVLDSPKQDTDVFLTFDLTRFRRTYHTKKEYRTLAILSWYFPETIRVLFQLNLKEHWDKSDFFNIEKEVLLSSKELCLAWILTESGWTERDFFGNVLNRKTCSTLLDALSFVKMSQRKVKKYTGYCRGYQDNSPRSRRSFPAELEVWVVDPVIQEQKIVNYQLQVNCLRWRLTCFLKAC